MRASCVRVVLRSSPCLSFLALWHRESRLEQSQTSPASRSAWCSTAKAAPDVAGAARSLGPLSERVPASEPARPLIMTVLRKLSSEQATKERPYLRQSSASSAQVSDPFFPQADGIKFIAPTMEARTTYSGRYCCKRAFTSTRVNECN